MRKIFLFAAAAALTLCACAKLGPERGEDAPDKPSEDIPGTSGSTYKLETIAYDNALATDSDANLSDKSDTDIYWEAEAESDGTFKNTITIVYNGNDAAVTLNSKAKDSFKYEKSGAHVAIMPAGTEVKKCEIILSGSTDNGSLKIYCAADPNDKNTAKKIKLTLNGVKLKSQSGPAINYQTGKRMYLHLADGTDNYLEDCAVYSDDIYYFPGRKVADEDRKGCFFSEKAVIVSGKGRLYVQGNHKNAIAVDNDFYMRPGPTVVVTGAAKNCLSCNDEVHFMGGYFYALTKSNGGKGVKSDSCLVVDGGRLVINTAGVYDVEESSPKGFKIDGTITVNDGSLTIRSIGKCEGSEALESKTNITINGGSLDILAYDDAINAEDLITINGGNVFCVSTANDGIDSNGSIVINGGTVTSVAGGMEAGIDNDNPGQKTIFQINGGKVIGIGGMVYAPDNDSNQCSIVYYGCTTSTTEEMTVNDASGKAVLSITSPLGSRNAGVIFSSPEFSSGSTYTIAVGGKTQETVTLSGKVTEIGTQMFPGGPGDNGHGFGPGR